MVVVFYLVISECMALSRTLEDEIYSKFIVLEYQPSEQPREAVLADTRRRCDRIRFEALLWDGECV